MNNPAQPNVGDRLTAIRIPFITHEDRDGDLIHEWEFESLDFTVTRIATIDGNLRAYGHFSCRTDRTRSFRTRSFYATEWKPVSIVAVGDKIIPLPLANDDWYGLPEHCRTKVGTVTAIGDDYVGAEFPSEQKPDDTEQWSVARWRKRPTVGDTVRCIDPEASEIHGNVGTVDTDDGTSLPFWVKGFWATAPDRGVWMRPDEVEVVSDGETLTVSAPVTEYVPAAGDKVFAYEPNINIGGGPRWVGTYLRTTGDLHWVMREGSTAVYFARIEPYAEEKVEEPITFETRDRMVGKTIRAIRANHGVTLGETYEVVDTFHMPERAYDRKVDGITVGVRVNGSHVWVQEYEVIEDTPVAEYVPAVGDYVRFDAVLTNTGVDTNHDGRGVVIESSGGVYVVQTGRSRMVVTGPGHVFPEKHSDPRMGRIVTLRERDPEAPAHLVGKTGIVTGIYEETRPLVTFPRDVDQYLGQYPGAWAVFDRYLIEDGAEQPASEAPVATVGEVEELRRQLARANERVNEYSERAGKWERDFLRSWERIGQEATARNWCGEYERVVSDVQDDLEIGEIPPRINLVEHRVRITGTTYRDVTVWVQEGEDVADPDNWYESNDPDDKCDEDFMVNQIDREYSNNGFDDTEVRVIR